MVLTLDPERQVKSVTNDCCGGDREVVTGFVCEDGEPHAAYFASCYPHAGEIWIDVILGSWESDRFDDHVTFGCRFGAIDGHAEPACSLVPAASIYGSEAIFGRKLDREQALEHPWLERFWAVVDFILTTDPTVRHHAYCPPAS